MKYPERETDESLPRNAEDEFVDVHLYSALHIHGVMNNDVDRVWEYGDKKDVFNSEGQDSRGLAKTA
jgi:hypothetical protein